MNDKKENPFTSLLINILIPAVILSKLSKENYLGPLYAFIIAISFPFLYGLYELIIKKKKSFIAVFGLVSIFLTGIIGIMNFPKEYIAYKEALIPFIIGMAILISIKTPFPLVRKIIFNDAIFDIDMITDKLQLKNNTEVFNKTLNGLSIFLSLSFFISSILNFVLAKILIKSDPGTLAFNEELGKMVVLSYPIIALPSTLFLLVIIWYFIRTLSKLTDTPKSDLFAKEIKDMMAE